MDEDLQQLQQQLIKLHHALRDKTSKKYQRINPFNEDLFEWKERGEYLFGKGKNITVYNTCTVVGEVTVGENTWIGPYSSLDGAGGIRIGCYCSISSGVNILTHDSAKWALSRGKAPYEQAPVTIGNCCFISTGVVITKGVTIGDHCLIGAGAVVTKDIPDYSIAVGIPARLIGTVSIDGDQIFYDYNTCKTDRKEKSCVE